MKKLLGQLEIRSILTFLFCFLLPAGWAKHWIAPNSLVNGVLVDYLMPDIWVQDLIAVILIAQILLARYSKFASLKLKHLISPRDSGVNINLLISGLFVLISVFLSPIPLTSVVNLLRFLLALGTAWIIFENKNLRRPALMGLSAAVVWTSLLAVGQFINQGTVIGWRFLGEPIFSSGTGGVKKIFLFGRELIAPMATFPHANVMGAFGLLSFLVLKNKKIKYLSLILIFLSFSLPVWLITVFLLIRKFKSTYVALFLSMVLGVVVLRVMGYGLPISSIYRRLNLIGHAWTMIKSHPFFGVGWGGFVKNLPPSTFLQPVHNVFLLVFAELGLIGTAGLVLLARQFLKKLEFKNYLLLITVYLLLFSLDHYFWTTTQGVYMLLLFLSMSDINY